MAERNAFEIAIDTANSISDALNYDTIQRAALTVIFLRSIPSANKNIESKTYIILDERTGLYKIGKSCNPIARENTLQSEYPLLKIIFVIDKDVESDLHLIYKSKRIRGEWFKLSKNDIDFIFNSYQNN